MNIKDAKKLLQESSGKAAWQLNFPTLGNEVNFKELTVGQQKSITKMGLADDELQNIDLRFARLAALEETALTEFESESITNIEFIAACAMMREANFSNPLKLNITCGKCGAEFGYTVDMVRIVENVNNFKFKVAKQSFKSGESELTLVFGEPTAVDAIAVDVMMHMLKKEGEYTEKDYIFYNALSHIRKASVNGEEIEGFAELDFDTRIEFIEDTKIDIEEKIESVYETFPADRKIELFPSIKCPKCQDVKEGLADERDFFTV